MYRTVLSFFYVACCDCMLYTCSIMCVIECFFCRCLSHDDSVLDAAFLLAALSACAAVFVVGNVLLSVLNMFIACSAITLLHIALVISWFIISQISAVSHKFSLPLSPI